MNDLLEKITAFASEAHGDQRRKYTPEAYIAHPVRVMETCRAYAQELPVLAAALLHDVLEDTPVDTSGLHAFLTSIMSADDSKKTLTLVTELTDVYTKAAWPRMNRRSRKNKEAERLSKVSGAAQTIKYADIMDNARAISAQDADFGPVYLRECAQLLSVMQQGNETLRKQAMEVVETELTALKNN